MPDGLEAFTLTQPLWEIAARSTIVFLALVAFLRIIPSRNAGHISPNDMLIPIIVGTIGASAIMAGSYAVSDLMLMIILVLLWGYVLDLLEYHVPAVRRLMRHRQNLLIEDGHFLRRNMRHEMVTEEELLSVLRHNGIGSVSEVRSALMEADGVISVLRKDDSGDGPKVFNED